MKSYIVVHWSCQAAQKGVLSELLKGSNGSSEKLRFDVIKYFVPHMGISSKGGGQKCMAEVELPDTNELEELKGKKFTKRVALTTAIYAVLLAITSLGGNNAMKEMLLAQQQSSDQWAFYQSKVMREHLYKTQKMQMEVGLIERGKSMTPEVRRHYEDKIKKIGEEEERYRKEKSTIEQEAKRLESEREINRRKDPFFDYAEVLLQIAIVLSSIAILSSSHGVFAFSMISAAAGSILSLNGYLLIFKIPFFH